MKKRLFTGVCTALVTPFLNGQVNYPLLEQLLKLGAKLQVNAYSYVEEKNSHIKNTAQKLLREQKVFCVGSDAHNLKYRPAKISSGVEYVIDNATKEYAQKVLYQNLNDFLGL